MLRFAGVCLPLLAVTVLAQGPPATEVFLATLKVDGDTVTIQAPLNISNNPGYDNQPSFTPDGASVLFTSVRGDRKPDPANSASIGSDIYRYDIASKQITQVTNTPESEYSPTITPDGRHISVVRVESDGTQRLWRFTIDGKTPELVLADVKPVGYHAWADANTLALFVLGEPPTLQLADVRTGKAQVVAKDIGRSIQRIPNGGISYVQRESKAGATALTVLELIPASRQTTVLVRVPPNINQPDLTWTPDGMLLMASGGKLYGWRRGQAEMKVVADLDAIGLRGVSRLAVSPRNDRIAFVAQP
jgi:dipeptidyl aminopeptidase/acylaminoacyl peptidase